MKKALVFLAVVLGVSRVGAQPAVVKYYHLDGLGSVRAVTDEAGQLLERHEYLPFGEEWNPQPAGDSRKFTGKERDAETGLDYFGARYYGAEIGRFTTVDPVYTWRENLVDPQRWNRYAYVRNNPLRYMDPDGRAIETPWDILNIGIGVVSFGANVAAGNVGGAAVDAAGIVVDVLATAVPGVPGGAGTAIKAARAADKVGDVARAADKVGDVAKHADTLKPGPFAVDSIPAHRGRPTAAEQRKVNELMEAHGCHTCGTNNPGTKSGNAIADHQPAQALGEPKVFLPHCNTCKARQGGQVLQELRKVKEP